MSGNCASCATPLRPTSVFCPGCGAPTGGGGSTQGPTPTPAGFTVPAARPASVQPPRQPPKRGTVVKEQAKKPGTVLYQAKNELPVCGWLVILRGRRQGRDFRIEKDTSVLGRAGTCDYVVEDDTVSGEHCRVRKDGDQFHIHDLGSGNGTYLNGERVYHAELTDGDILKVGESLVLFKQATARIPISQADVPTQGSGGEPSSGSDGQS